MEKTLHCLAEGLVIFNNKRSNCLHHKEERPVSFWGKFSLREAYSAIDFPRLSELPP